MVTLLFTDMVPSSILTSPSQVMNPHNPGSTSRPLRTTIGADLSNMTFASISSRTVPVWVRRCSITVALLVGAEGAPSKAPSRSRQTSPINRDATSALANGNFESSRPTGSNVIGAAVRIPDKDDITHDAAYELRTSARDEPLGSRTWIPHRDSHATADNKTGCGRGLQQ